MSEIYKGGIEAEKIAGALSDEEKKSIFLRAELRRNFQEFKVNLLNLKTPETGEKYKSKYEKTLSLVKKEADGEKVLGKKNAEKILSEESNDIIKEAERFKEIAPNQSKYLIAYLTKLEEEAGEDYFKHYEEAKKMGKTASCVPKLAPADLLSDAILMGIEKRSMEKMPLPNMKKIAEAILIDRKLLENYALVLGEGDRDDFLKLIPEDKRKEISNIMDAEVSKLLHQSLVEKGTSAEEQRRNVRIRLFREIQEAMSSGEGKEKAVVKMLGQAFGSLGEDTRQLLLELIRGEYESKKIEGGKVSEYLPRIVKVMLDNFDDFRANDMVLHLAAEDKTNPHLSQYLFEKLIDKGYVDKNVREWLDRQSDKKLSLEVLKKSVSELGVMPTRDILEFISSDRNWQRKNKTLNLDERIAEIRESQKEFEEIKNIKDLIGALSRDEKKAMIYYLLHGGDDRFNLVNNYDFGKFKEMVKLISRFKIHQKPLDMFKSSLQESGLPQKEIDEITARLIGGHFPLEKRQQAYQEASFEVSANAALLNANKELGAVLGKNQLGTVLAFPIYREFLEKEQSETAKNLLEEMGKATTFSDRQSLIEKINIDFPGYKEKLKKDLGENWVKFGEKMVLELTLDQVLTSDEISIKGQELLPRLDAKRIDLKRINKELIVALKSENKAMKNISQKISKKKKAIIKLENGLNSQTNEEKKKKMQENIKKIEEYIANLERELSACGKMKVDERFSHLSPEEKKAEIDRLNKEIIALTEKSPSAIFTYIVMQVLGKDRLKENDISLVQEMESHLQGPFQTISDLMNYERSKDTEKKRMRVGLEYLDKTERLMNMVRFADSKICCFSSNNYNMVVAHGTPNKVWVASINADPMSFVISMEIPQEKIEGKRTVKENVGFIFGSYGVNESGGLAILLNGIYYAPGIENKLQVESILNGVERIFKGLPIKTIAIASQWGGRAVGERLPADYSNESIELTRLRALDDGGGSPENKIYDDLDTGNDLNKPHFYSGHVWHKNL